MAKCQRKQTNVLLAFQVLHFVSQLRRRVQPRVQRGFDDDLRLRNKLPTDREVLRRASEGLSRLRVRDAKQPQRIANRICKYRKSNLNASRPVLRLRTSGSDGPGRSNESGEEVQQYVERSFRLVSSTKLPT
jgi:hypothetical protein